MKNLGVDGINTLTEMGIDLNNIQDLKGIAQLTESIGGVENLPQFLAALNNQNPEDAENQVENPEAWQGDPELQEDMERAAYGQPDEGEEGQSDDKELQFDENILAHLQ